MRIRFALWMLASSAVCFGVDGVVLIDQSRALAGGVSPGDAPGFPVTISQRGSYRLSSSLTLPDANTTGIEVTAADVTIDLNGFSIVGPVVCSGGGFNQSDLSCSGTGTGRGILAQSNVTVINGTVRGVGNIGIIGGENCRIEKVHAISNGATGISTLNGCVITESVAMRNGATGLFGQNGTFVSDTAYGNGDTGISCTAGCQISKSAASYNGSSGFAVAGGSILSNSSGFGNKGSGISNVGASVIGNSISGSGGIGLYCQDGIAKDNLVSGSTNFGLFANVNCSYSGNTLLNNNGGGIQISTAPSSRNLGGNVCGAALCP